MKILTLMYYKLQITSWGFSVRYKEMVDNIEHGSRGEVDATTLLAFEKGGPYKIDLDFE